MGRYEEALQAYNAVITDHPENMFAKNGRACALIQLGRFAEALLVLDVQQPTRFDDWVSFHIKGMTLLKQGQIVEAVDLFRLGLRDCPWHDERRYFASALAVAEMRLGQLDAARESLAAIDVAEDPPPITLIRLHLAGALGERDEAERVHYRLPEQLPHDQRELRDELERRYLSCLPAGQSDDWVFNREIECLLTAA
jgi:tetratricopeptide (TPR) repeat protein